MSAKINNLFIIGKKFTFIKQDKAYIPPADNYCNPLFVISDK